MLQVNQDGGFEGKKAQDQEGKVPFHDEDGEDSEHDGTLDKELEKNKAMHHLDLVEFIQFKCHGLQV